MNTMITLATAVKLLAAIPVLPIIWRVVPMLWKTVQSRMVKKGSHPFTEDAELREAIRYYVDSYGQNVSPANEDEPSSNFSTISRKQLIRYFINEVFHAKAAPKLHIIIADSGMGKSTFLANLLVQYQSLFRREKYAMQLIPLGHAMADNEIGSGDPEKLKDTILMLDAFDEDVQFKGDWQERLNAIVRKAYRYKFLLITCRTQFFPSEAEEPYATNLLKVKFDKYEPELFHKMYLSPFTPKDIDRYLSLKYPIWKPKSLSYRRRAKNLVMLCPNLMVRPMLLSHMDYLLQNSNITGVTPKSASDAYALLAEYWIIRESQRLPQERQEHFVKNMNQFSMKIAYDMFMKRTSRLGLYIRAGEIAPLAEECKIELDELELKGKSLLTRDATGMFKFSHKSIFEFMLAKYALENPTFAQGVYYFIDLKGFDMAQKFYAEMDTLSSPEHVRNVYSDDGTRFIIGRQYDFRSQAMLYSVRRENGQYVVVGQNSEEEAMVKLIFQVGPVEKVKLLGRQMSQASYVDKNGMNYILIYDAETDPKKRYFLMTPSGVVKVDHMEDGRAVMELAKERYGDLRLVEGTVYW